MNSWVDRFPVDMSDAEIKRRTLRIPAPLLNLAQTSAVASALRIEQSLRELFVLSSQGVQTLKQLIDLARGYAQESFPDTNAYVRQIYAEHIDVPTRNAICISGLAGTGKTELLAALRRLLPSNSEISIPTHATVPLVATWSIKVRPNQGVRQMLEPHFLMGMTARGDAVLLARRQLTMQGVCLIVMDELQFLSQSIANNNISKILLTANQLGPPLIYAANFSLLNRLALRAQEERQRLLSEIIVLQPDPIGSADWREYVNHIAMILPEFRDVSTDAMSAELYAMTFAIKRNVTLLLTQGYREMRSHSRDKIIADDLRNAYGSRSYSSARLDVELLNRQAISGSPTRLDLWCPFSETRHAVSAPEPKNIAETHERQVAHTALRSLMTSQERDSHEKIVGTSGKQKSRNSSLATKRNKATIESLLAGTNSMIQSIRQK